VATATVEPLLLMGWAYDRLDADATLTTLLSGGSVNVVPVQGSPAFPRIIISSPYSLPDTVALEDGAPREMASPALQVDVIGDDGMPWADLEQIAARCDVLLHGTGGASVPGRGEIIEVYRTEVSVAENAVGDKVYPRIMQRYQADALAA
jgi:hypothetical protein